jgi:hypothetical protein
MRRVRGRAAAAAAAQVIKMFALKQPAQLRERLAQLQREHQLGKVGNTPFAQQAVEILTALKKLKQTVRCSDAKVANHDARVWHGAT